MKKWIPQKKIMTIVIGATVVGVAIYCISLFLVLKETKKIENLRNDIDSSFSEEEKSRAP